MTPILAPSPNHSTRGPNRPRILVIHATAGLMPGCLSWLRNPASRVSAHYLIDKAGRVYSLVDEARTAWHAGVSQWRGMEVWAEVERDGRRVRVPSVNPTSIGIELENANNGRDPYPEAQVAALTELSRGIVARHRIERLNLVRHLDVSPGRKTDPTPPLDWDTYVADVYGDSLALAYRTKTRGVWARISGPSLSSPYVVLEHITPVTVHEWVRGDVVDGSVRWGRTDKGYIHERGLEPV